MAEFFCINYDILKSYVIEFYVFIVKNKFSGKGLVYWTVALRSKPYLEWRVADKLFFLIPIPKFLEILILSYMPWWNKYASIELLNFLCAYILYKKLFPNMNLVLNVHKFWVLN